MAQLKDNTHRNQFELETDGKLSIVAYQPIDGQTIAITHTEVDPSLEGHGVGSKLVEEMLQFVEQHNLKIVPLCPFVSVYLQRHPAWNRVVSTTHTATGF